MKYKRILILLLALCMTVGLVPAAAFAASTELVIETPAAMPKAGESFTVTLSIKGNPGFNAADICLGYDKAAMSCTSIVLEEVMKDMLSASNPAAAKGAMIAAAVVSPVSADGKLATFRFKAVKDLDGFDFTLVDTGLRLSGSNISFTVAGGTASETPGSGSAGGTVPPTQPGTGETPAAISFTDVNGHWAYDFIIKAAEYGLFNGYTDGSFKPDDSVTRAQFVTVLWRLAGKPECTTAVPFPDVNTASVYYPAIAWAYSNGYISGYNDGTFKPNNPVTREQTMKILFGFDGGKSGGELAFTSIYDQNFTDSDRITPTCKAGVYWGVYKELISGSADGSKYKLNPRENASRAQLAKILVSYIDKKAE